MSMRLGKTAFSLFLMLLPAAAGAVDLELSGEAVTGYDDNIFRTYGNETGDADFRFTPVFGLSSQDSKLGWRLRYQPTYEVFPQHTDADNLTHQIWGSIDYALDEKTAISLSEAYRHLEVLNYPLDEGVDDETLVAPEPDISREKIDINDGSFDLTHAFSPKWTGYTSASYRLFYTSRTNSNNSKSFAGSQSFQYALNASNDLGLGGSVTVQMFDALEYQPASNSFFYNLFGSWERRFGEGTTLTIQAGPALVHTDQDDAGASLVEPFPHVVVGGPGMSVGTLRQEYPTLDTSGFNDVDPVPAGSVIVPDPEECNNNYVIMADHCVLRDILLNDPDVADEDADTVRDAPLIPLNVINSNAGASGYKFTIFAEAKLTQRWTPTLLSSLEYSRRDATASAQGSGTVQDLVSFVTAWQPTERWDLSLRGTYLRRNSPSKVSQILPGVVPWDGSAPYVTLSGDALYLDTSNVVDTERWSVYGRIARRVTRRTTMTLRLSYSDQQTKRSDRNPDNFHDFMALVGVRYDFDPIRF
jgi:hypothetical protein